MFEIYGMGLDRIPGLVATNILIGLYNVLPTSLGVWIEKFCNLI